MAAAEKLLRLANRAKKDEGQWFDDNDDKSDSGSEEEVDHEDLLKKIKSLDRKEISKRHKGPLRSELNQNVSEFHLKSEGDDGRVNLDDLVGSLQASSYHSKLKKSLESLQKMGHTVEVPLAKPAAERIQRVVAYEETSKDISKWDATVQKNRRAEQLSFPLDAYKHTEMSTTTMATTFKPRTPLEQEIASVLQNSSQMLEREDKELSLEEEEALKNMSLEEALERRHELQKLRALQSYYEQKCRRMKKIKSKKYHRIKRKAEKRANSTQTFEQLQKENPELAQVELEKAEKLRVQERMSLKHRNTSKWAKNIIAKGVNDVQARQALSEQLRISRQLTETKTIESDSDEDEANKAEDKAEIPENFKNFGLVGDSSENPWLLNDGKEREDMNEETEGHENTKERLRKLKAVTAEETKEGQDGGQDEEEKASDNSDQDETFELMDESGAQESGKKRKKTRVEGKNIKEGREERKKTRVEGKNIKEGREERKKTRVEGKNIKEGREKRKKLKEVKNVTEEGLKKKGRVKGKKKKNISKRNNEEGNDVEEKTEGNKVENLEENGVKKKGKMKGNSVVEKTTEVKKKKRKITEEYRTKEKSKKSKKAKLVKSGLDEDIGEETGQDRVFGDDHEQLLMEGDGVDDHEGSPSQTLDIEITDAPEIVPEKSTLNPKNVFQIEDLGLQSDLLNYTADDDSDSETRAQRMTIQEAFANDDVIEEFVKEKDETTEASKNKDLDVSLPGWGDWGGPGIDETKRRKKFTVPAKPVPPRKDNKLAHVIIKEDRDKKFAKNQVSQLPFPFTSRDQWERSVRVPLGKDWNTTSVHQKLIKPRIVTLPGTIIEPIKPSKGVQRSAVVEDSGKPRHDRKKGAKTIGSGIEIHN